jgi:Tol biopolymer transport system component
LLVAVGGLLAFGVSVAHAAFPGFDGKIAFAKDLVASPHANQQDIVAMYADGTGFVNITNTPGHSTYDNEAAPAWSPDGSRLAFVSGPSPRHLWVINADGSGRKQITNNAYLYGEGDRHPSWSPDGERIFFTRDLEPAAGNCLRDFCDEIFRVNADGSGLTQITHDIANETSPEMSPNGDKIVFTKTLCEPMFPPPSRCPVGIYLMNPDGTGETALTSDGFEPSWSPDGSKIAFVSNRHSCCAGWEIYTMNADGSDPKRLTFSDRPSSGAFFALEPAWSPSGASIVFAYHLVSGSEIFTIKPDGSALTRVTNDDISDSDPDWQPIFNRPPDCGAVTATPDVLFPPNRQFVEILLAGATDPDGDAVTLTVDGVTQDEPVTTNGDPTHPDAIGSSAAGRVFLRSERNPQADGRVYKVAFTASDSRGDTCTGIAGVSVPRHTHVSAVDSAPPSFDSFGR